MDLPHSARQKLVILGTGELAPEILDLAEGTGLYEVEAFIENWDPEKTKRTLEGRPILWIEEAAGLTGTHKAVCGIASTRRSGFIRQAGALGFQFATLIDPSARISGRAQVGEGSIVNAGVIIGAFCRIGNHVILNRGALIGHHTVIGDYTTIHPGSNIAGAVHIGEGTYVGMGSIVIDHLRVGSDAMIGAGSLVTRDVPDRVEVVGRPARVVRTGIEGK